MTDWKAGLHPRHAARYDADPEYAAWVRSVKMKQRAIRGHVAILNVRNNLRLAFGISALIAFAVCYFVYGGTT